MLTARAAEDDKVRVLRSALMTTSLPFSPKGLVAQNQGAAATCGARCAEEPLEVAGLRLDPSSHRVSGNGVELKVGRQNFACCASSLARDPSA